MIQIQSNIEGKQLTVGEIKGTLEPMGFTVGGNWEYDHGFYDYKMNDDHGDQQYVRIPIQSAGGALDDEGTIVEIGTPFLLDHQFKTEVDEEGNIGALSGSFNQFKAPYDKDAPFPEKYVERGRSVIERAERALLGI